MNSTHRASYGKMTCADESLNENRRLIENYGIRRHFPVAPGPCSSRSRMLGFLVPRFPRSLAVLLLYAASNVPNVPVARLMRCVVVHTSAAKRDTHYQCPSHPTARNPCGNNDLSVQRPSADVQLLGRGYTCGIERYVFDSTPEYTLWQHQIMSLAKHSSRGSMNYMYRANVLLSYGCVSSVDDV